LAGEIDLANAGEVAARLDALVASTTGDVRVDCAGLEFIDSSGLEVLLGIHEELEASGRRLVLGRVTEFIQLVLSQRVGSGALDRAGVGVGYARRWMTSTPGPPSRAGS
jgi:anti-anti-sigma factor